MALQLHVREAGRASLALKPHRHRRALPAAAAAAGPAAAAATGPAAAAAAAARASASAATTARKEACEEIAADLVGEVLPEQRACSQLEV